LGLIIGKLLSDEEKRDWDGTGKKSKNSVRRKRLAVRQSPPESPTINKKLLVGRRNIEGMKGGGGGEREKIAGVCEGGVTSFDVAKAFGGKPGTHGVHGRKKGAGGMLYEAGGWVSNHKIQESKQTGKR